MYGSGGAAGGQAIFTDDVSLQVFMEHLKRLVRGFPLVPVMMLAWHLLTGGFVF
jgi:hypothetical protein